VLSSTQTEWNHFRHVEQRTRFTVLVITEQFITQEAMITSPLPSSPVSTKLMTLSSSEMEEEGDEIALVIPRRIMLPFGTLLIQISSLLKTRFSFVVLFPFSLLNPVLFVFSLASLRPRPSITFYLRQDHVASTHPHLVPRS
jgi:hypothetical protein